MIESMDSFSAAFNAAERRRRRLDGSDLQWAQDDEEDTEAGSGSFTHSSGSYSAPSHRDNHDVYHSMAADIRRDDEEKQQAAERSIRKIVEDEPVFRNTFSRNEPEPTFSEYLKGLFSPKTIGESIGSAVMRDSAVDYALANDGYVSPVEAASLGAAQPALSIGEAAVRSFDRDFGNQDTRADLDDFGNWLASELKKAKEAVLFGKCHLMFCFLV